MIEVLTVVASLAVAGLSGALALYKIEYDKRKKIELQLNLKKSDLYERYGRCLASVFYKDRKKKYETNSDNLSQDIEDLTIPILVHGSKSVNERHSWLLYYLHSEAINQTHDNKEFFLQYLNHVVDIHNMMRGELGHSNDDLSLEMVANMFLVNPAEILPGGSK